MESSKMRTLLSLLGVAAVRAFGSFPDFGGSVNLVGESNTANPFCPTTTNDFKQLLGLCKKVYFQDDGFLPEFTEKLVNQTQPSRWCGSITNQTECGGGINATDGTVDPNGFGLGRGEFRGMRVRRDGRIDLCATLPCVCSCPPLDLRRAVPTRARTPGRVRVCGRVPDPVARTEGLRPAPHSLLSAVWGRCYWDPFENSGAGKCVLANLDAW